MKVKTLILSILLFYTADVFAQYKEYAFGLSFAPNWNRICSADETTRNNHTLVGYSWGVFAEKHHSGLFATSLGVRVDKLRADHTYLDMRSDGIVSREVAVTRRVGWAYLDIPLAAKLYVADVALADIYVQGGVDLGVRLKAKAADHYQIGVNLYDPSDLDVRKEYSLFNIGLNVGLGSEFAILPRLKAFAQLRYHYSLTNLVSTRHEGDLHVRPSCFALDFGIIL